MSETLPLAAPVEATTTPPELSEEEKYRLVLIDQSDDARDQARDLADEQLTNELNEGNWFKRAVGSVWKGNLLKDYYRQKYTREHEAKIRENNDVLQSETLPEARTKAINSLVDRFQNGEEELIHTNAGEKREVHTDDVLSAGLKDLIRRFAVEGTLNETTLDQEKKRLLEAYGQANPTVDLSKSLVLTDNLLEVAQSIKGRFTHDEAMESAISNMEIITGEARNGARTEAHYSKADKLALFISERMSKTKLGSLATPGAVAIGTALVLSAAGVGTKAVVGAAAATAGLGTVAGVWAGLRENKKVKDERSQHSREMATGGQFEEGDKRRTDMEKTRYESVSAKTLTEEIENASSDEVFDSAENQSEALQAALEAIARAQARTELSDSKNIDLITYSSKADVGEERLKLDLARIESRKRITERLSPELRAELGLDDEVSAKDIIDARTQAYIAELEEGMTSSDKAFNALKRRRVLTAAAIGTGVGIAGGLISQEIIAGIDPGRYGVFEAASGAPAPINAEGDVHQTILASAFNGESTTESFDASTTYDQFDTDPSTESFVKVGDDQEWVTNPDGTHTIIGPDGKPSVENITINADGSMDQATIDRIEAAGLDIEDNTWTEPVEQTITEQMSPEQYWQNHTAEMEPVAIDKWFNNNTAAYDQNELRVFRGGENGIVDGGYRFESGMTPEGSYLGDERVNAVEAIGQGNFVWVVSRMGEDSGPMFTIPSGPDGSLTVMEGDPAGALFSNVNGQAQLAEGFRLHAYLKQDIDANGVIHGGSLATYVGEAEVASVTDTRVIQTEVVHHEYQITSNGYEVERDNITEIAPITPVVGRRPLERLAQERAGSPESPRRPGYDYYGGEIDDAERERIRAELSPRLQQNPETILNPKAELDWFREELATKQGADYVADIAAFVENDPYLSRMNNNTDSIVIMPVRGASESESIYGTLSLYAQQDREADKNTTLLLNVNWLDTVMDNPEDVTAIQKTIAEIERARQDFPGLTISVIQKEYNEVEVKKTGGVIGYVVNDLINTALLATQHKMADGSIDPGHEVLILRSDADVDGLSRTQLTNYEKSAKENQSVDVFKGIIRFGVENQQKFPGFGIVTNFSQALSAAKTQENRIHTGGPNFAVRASTLAAVGGFGDLNYTGVASDDVGIGNRVSVGRNIGYPQYGYESNVAGATGDTKRIKLVSGAAIDTNADRLLPFYANGLSFQAAWDGTAAGFDAGPGGYANRDINKNDAALGSKERYDEDSTYKAIEVNLSRELQYASERSGRKALAVFFGSVAGAYRVTGGIGTGDVKIELTSKGREFIKNRVQRETNGKFGSYGLRKMRQLYGVTKPGAKRQSASTTAPLVSPLS